MSKVVVIVFLVAMVVAVAAGADKSDAAEGSQGNKEFGSAKSMCESTNYKEACEKSLNSSKSNDPKELMKTTFQATMDEIKKAMENSDTVKEAAKDPMSKQALDICKEVMEDAIDDLQKAFDEVGEFNGANLKQYIENLECWLSGAVAYEETCLDAFENTTDEAGKMMKDLLSNSIELTSNALAMISKLTSMMDQVDLSPLTKAMDKIFGTTNDGHRKLLFEDGLPSWVSAGQRMILEAPKDKLQPFAVVAKDGSGKYKSINAALKEVPLKSNDTFIIFIKAGVYEEQVIVDKGMNNVVFIGEGATKTKITGGLNFIDGVGTFKTATLAAVGERFMAKGIGVENTAGAIKHQAVALRVQSDRSIFYQCQFDGYQDTLYAHSHRQFYRDCTVSGTIDFIFGDSQTVFQNCKLIVRKPLENQGCMVTAQGKKESNENTALVLHNCSIVGDPAFIPNEKNKAYLGRPWKEYSKTIVMQSFIDKIIDPTGWCEWNGDYALNTLYYAEFENRGPGADLSKRVKWKGLKEIDKATAEQFTPGKFFLGDEWIPQSGSPYTSGMVTGL